jgi:hypothetical protein
MKTTALCDMAASSLKTGTNFRNEIAASVISFENGGNRFLGKFGGQCPFATTRFNITDSIKQKHS